MKKDKKHRKHSSLAAATIIRSATAQVQRRRDTGLASTGTNISYEGATAPGAGGSVGTGFASGKEAADETITTNSDYVQNRGGKAHATDDNDDEPDISAEDFYLDDDFC